MATFHAAAAAKISGAFRRYIWNARFLDALIITSPSVLAWIGGTIVELAVERDLRPVKSELGSIQTEMSDLDRFLTRFENNELDRGALLLLMNAASADMPLRYRSDQLYRVNVNAIGSLRRTAAIVYPDSWQEVMKPYEEIVAQDYDTPDAVASLQNIENGVIAAAKARLVRDQQRFNALADTSENYERRRGYINRTLQYLGFVLSIFLFFYKQPAPKPGGKAKAARKVRKSVARKRLPSF